MSKISIAVSVPTFHEISQKLEENGKKLNDASEITLTKDTALERPLDWRLITVRKDCVIEAAKIYQAKYNTDNSDHPYFICDPNDFIKLCDKIYNYVVHEIKPTQSTDLGVVKTEPGGGWR